MLEKHTFVEISTCHIAEDTAKKLDDKSWNEGICVYDKAEYGWFIPIPEDFPKGYNNLPPELFSCMMFAKRNGCDWLCLDCDGPEVDELQKFDW